MGAAIGAVSQIACNIIDNALVDLGIKDDDEGKKSVFDGVTKAVVVGFVGGAATALFPAANSIISATMSAAESLYSDWKDGESVGTMIVNATLSAGFGAVTSGEPVFSDAKIISKTVNAVAKSVSGNHPVVKKTAKTFLKGTFKAIRNEFCEGIADGLFVNYINEGTKWFTNKYLGLKS